MPIDTGYEPRVQFKPFHTRHQRWGITVAHVRAGKTVAAVNDLIDASLKCKLSDPRHAYIAPTYAQAKDIAWTYLKKYTLAIPGATPHESELRIDLPGGRRIRLYGAENYWRISGVYFDGIVLDEYDDMDPRAFPEVLRARLTDRRGWAMFMGTPKPSMQLRRLWEQAQGDPAWFTLRLRASETGIIPQAELDDARRSMTDEDYAAQYEASFAASGVGSVYGKQLEQADIDGRVCGVPWQPEFGVETWWDIGTGDSTAIWFTQTVGREVHVIDYYEANGVGIDHYAHVLHQLPYDYLSHNGPHDIRARSFAANGKSTYDVARELGIQFNDVPKMPKADGLGQARLFMQRCWFDRVKTQRGRDALAAYRFQWNERLKMFSAEPFHDWSSHGSDAFRYLAIGHKIARAKAVTNIARPVRSGRNSWLAA